MHPIIGIITVILTMILLLLISHPIYVLLYFTLTAFVLWRFKELKLIYDTFHYLKWPMMMIVIINPIFVQLGNHVIIELDMGPFHFLLSLESLLYSGTMTIKLLTMVIIFQMLGQMTDSGDLFTWMSKYCRQLTLTFSISSNAVETIKSEYARVQMVMTTRGMFLDQGDFTVRMKNSIYLIKVVFIGLLENTFDRSEALFVRHYTKTPGSEFQPLRWALLDQILLGLQSLVVVLIIYAVVTKQFNFEYYPTFNGTISRIVVYLITSTILLIYLGIKEQKKNEQMFFN